MIRNVMVAGLVLGVLTFGLVFAPPQQGGAWAVVPVLPPLRDNTPKRLDINLGGGVIMKMVRIEAGTFVMGSPQSEQKYVRDRFGDGAGDLATQELQHEVVITRPFFMGVFEVTQQEYEKVIGNNPSTFKGERHPVDSVSWDDAMAFCKKLSELQARPFDLPTEAEWEFASRAGSKEAFHYGKSLSSKQANFNGTSPFGDAEQGPNLEKTVPVGSYAPNAFGLYDMHGNVQEWCKDVHKFDYYKDSPQRDPQGPETGKQRVARGGHWYVYSQVCRCAYRCPFEQTYTTSHGGFRVVLRLP